MSARAPRPSWLARALARPFLLSIEWARFDWHLLALASVLLGVGLLLLHAMSEADAVYARPSAVDFEGHVQKLALALPVLLAALFLRPNWLRRRAWWIYAAAIALLVLVPIIGQERNHARRWIPLPIGFDLQPSELAKIALIIGMARVLLRNRLESPRAWLGPLAVTLLPMALVMKQPDLGTALTLAPIGMGMCYLAGARMRTLAGIAGLALLVGFAAYRFEWVRDYQRQRVDTWLSTVSAAPLIEARNGAAFHVYHARVAIGNGGFGGTGLGEGVANLAGHLPERDCDSIFSVVAEEGGWFGACALMLTYAALAAGFLGSAGALRERFSRLVVGGVGLYFGAHLLIHAGVNLGLLPLTGLPLPLLSTGGSALLACFGALGLGLGIAAHREPALDEDAFR